MFELNERVALVTGGGRDVGAAISEALAAAGASVAVNYHGSKDAAEAVVARIQKAGGKARAYQADISDAATIKRLVDQVSQDFGGLDILVNNAGLVMRQRFSETTTEDWRKQIDTCLYGALNCCHSAGPLLEKSGRGRIISIMGDSSRVGESGLALAAAARAGTIALMKSLAREWGRSGVTANSISLGLIETAHDKSWVALLASDAGSWITGQVISINGGYSMV
jgi:NAD(P)-dependent dehydrogenase (short-subunit alcohol dehydrogenase family)